MKSREPILLIAILLLISQVYGQSQRNSQAPDESKFGETVEVTSEDAYKFKSKTLKGQVAEAMEQAKQNSVGVINDLMDSHTTHPDEVLTFLWPYLKDENEDVRFAVIEAASRVRTDQALSLLIAMVSDKTISHEAISRLYDRYTCQELTAKGGPKFKSSLLWAVMRNRYSTYGTMLLSCYKDDPTIVTILESRRKSYPAAKESVKTSPPTQPQDSSNDATYQRSTTDEVITLDLALTELGQKAALERVQQRFVAHKKEELLALLGYLKFVNNRTVLLQAVELLKDKSNAEETGFPGRPPVYIRMCDEALIALEKRAGMTKQLDSRIPSPHFSDKELLEAYEKLRTTFNAP